MLTAVNTRTSQMVPASVAMKGEGYVCGFCEKDVVLKQGSIRISHFAHRADCCEYGSGESERHREAKLDIYNSLCSLGWKSCELEKKIGNIRPDIYLCSHKGCEVGIELQISTMTIDDVIARTSRYAQLGIHVLWMPLIDDFLAHKDRYAPKVWEKWLHSLYFGRVYYWVEGKVTKPIHFGKYDLSIPYSEWYETGGELASTGGYDKRSKRYRTPCAGDYAEFPKDFLPVDRGEWRGGDIYIPQVGIILDRQEKWWIINRKG
jgi:competence protein CoiA